MRAAIVSFLLLACAGCASIEQAMRPHPPDPKSLMPALETRIAILVADERLRIAPDAKALVIDPELGNIARQRAADMATKNYFAHTAPNGDTSASLLMAEDAHFQGLLGENMAAQHYRPAIGIDIDAFARRFVATWLASSSHKENLSFPDYNRTGVGAAVNGDTVYVTQLFATDLGLGPHQDGTPPAVVTPLPNARSGLPADSPRGSGRGH
jgi:uncharacterized protein YkwD